MKLISLKFSGVGIGSPLMNRIMPPIAPAFASRSPRSNNLSNQGSVSALLIEARAVTENVEECALCTRIRGNCAKTINPSGIAFSPPEHRPSYKSHDVLVLKFLHVLTKKSHPESILG